MSPNYRAAWIPSTVVMTDLDDTLRRVIAWAEADGSEHNIQGLLVADTQRPVFDNPLLTAFTKRHAIATPRGGQRLMNGAVVAFFPTLRAFDLAMKAAAGGSLTLIEHPSTPLHGWAAEASALNLLDPDWEHPPLQLELDSAVDSLAFEGHNGYGPAPDRKAALRILGDLRSAGLLDMELIAGVLVARGVSFRSVERLQKLANSI